MQKFLGASKHLLDAKARLNLPTRFVVEPGEELVLTAGPDRCVLMLSKASWERAAAQLNDSVFCSSRQRHLRRLFVGHAEHVTADSARRIVITDFLRRYANIDTGESVALIGVGDMVEIYPTGEKWDRLLDSSDEDSELFDVPNIPGSSRELPTPS
jgi:MraZ protein